MKKRNIYIFAVLCALLLIVMCAQQFINKPIESLNNKTGFPGIELEDSDMQVAPEEETIINHDTQKFDGSIEKEENDELDAEDKPVNKEDIVKDSIQKELKDTEMEKNNIHENVVEPPKNGSDIEI